MSLERPLRIALVHSYYASRQPSGENTVVDAQARALRAQGIDVQLIGISTDDEELRKGYKLRTALSVATGYGASPLEQLEQFRPDVVHVHNLFPNWGTRWLTKWTGPIVVTVHNFRPVCAAGTLFRDGAACTLCPDGSSMEALKHACYRGSKVATLPLAIRNHGGVKSDPLLNRANRVVLLSNRARDMYIGFGLPMDKIRIVPNFIEDSGFTPMEPPGAGWVYIGRLTEEKGIMNLIRYWPESESLSIYGDGPLRGLVESSASDNVRYMGHLKHEGIPQVLSDSRGLVFPSEWAEGLPLVYAEALASGRPVVAKKGNSAADDVEASETGEVFGPWTDLADSLSKVSSNSREIGMKARKHYESIYTRESWVKNTIAMYGDLVRTGADRHA